MTLPRDLPPAVSPAPLAETQARLRDGTATLREEVSQILERLSSRETRIAALLPDETPENRQRRLLQQAEELDQRWQGRDDAPPLYGALVGVKDLFHVAGFPTRAGSQLPPEVFASNPATEGEEAPVVTSLRSNGALVLGKTVSTEFAYFAPGPTRNPWNPDHTPGGSSSGSAAAVAAGFCHFALGTQTIGSISRPATFCGVTGYKPSYGRVSTTGVVPFSPDADHIGPIAPNVQTLHTVASVVVSDWDRQRATADLSVQSISAVPRHPDLRHAVGPVLVPDDAYLEQADIEGRRALEAVIERLTGLGIDVQRIAVFGDIAEINVHHQNMIARDFAEVHHAWIDEHGKLYHERSRDLVERGRNVSEEERQEAREGRYELRLRLQETLQRHGGRLWLAPATVGGAPLGIDTTGDPIMNLPWTYSGVPTISTAIPSLPHGRAPTGLPLGVQWATPFGMDEELFAQLSVLEPHL